MTTKQTIAQPFDFTRDALQTKQRGLWSQALQRLIRNRLAMIAGVFLIVVIIVALLGTSWSVVQRHDPTQQIYTTPAGEDNTNTSSSGAHWLGTDNLGRDVWARVLEGTLFSLKVGFGAEFIVVCIGITLGMTAALGGRTTDSIITWITDLAYAFPDLLAIILVRQVIFGRGWPIIG